LFFLHCRKTEAKRTWMHMLKIKSLFDLLFNLQ